MGSTSLQWNMNSSYCEVAMKPARGVLICENLLLMVLHSAETCSKLSETLNAGMGSDFSLSVDDSVHIDGI